jgi:hypothetical protein
VTDDIAQLFNQGIFGIDLVLASGHGFGSRGGKT